MAEATARQEAQARVDAQAAETRRQMQEATARQAAEAEARKNVGIPSLMAMGSGMVMNPPAPATAPTTNPLTATAGRYGTMGYRAPAITGVSAEDRERMIRTVLGESGGESLIGQTGVASVIANRLRAGNYGSTIGDVVNAPKQFSTWNPGDPAGDMANRIDPNSQAYKNAADIVDSVLRGEARDPTGGALNFSNVNTVMTSGQASEATKARVAAESALPSATTIGRHTFTNPAGSTDTPKLSFTDGLRKTFDDLTGTVKDVAKTAADATGVSSALDFLTNTTARNELEQQYNRDKQMSREDMDILMFNRLHPEAGSNKELYGGRDRTPLPTQVAAATTPPAVVPPVVPPVDPVMPTVPTFAAAQRYTGTPTVATKGFDFSKPFAPRPSMDFANLGQAYAPTALPSASPQPLPGIPGAAYATPYQRLG
jgi:spore germination cell wall hydrolase CwlJ-like protein